MLLSRKIMLKQERLPKETLPFALITCAACAALGFASGCTPKPNAPAPQQTPRPSASAAPTPLPIAATVGGVHATLFNAKGEIVAQVAAQEGAMGSGGANGTIRPEGLGALKKGEATLYQNGKPSAVMNADTMEADRQAKTVVGTGNVRVRSLQKDAQNHAPAIRADTMTWQHDTNIIRGSGHVLLTNGPGVDLPGDGFEADTVLGTYRIWNGAEPKRSATGTF